jgi:hypothetical protein
VTRHDKVIDRILRGNADAGIRFQDLVSVLSRLNFDMRVKGDHHIFTKEGVAEILNLQPRDGKAKPYQVKQVRAVITAYGLATTDHEKEDEK